MITREGEDPDFFILPDIGIKLADIEKEPLSTEEKLQRKEVLLNEYSIKADRIHTVQQLLKAYTLFDKDVEYVVMEGQVKIVDEADRSYPGWKTLQRWAAPGDRSQGECEDRGCYSNLCDGYLTELFPYVS